MAEVAFMCKLLARLEERFDLLSFEYFIASGYYLDALFAELNV